ncbi:hypothetical protein SK128_009299, partial [Halocaridina rubra]
FEVIGSTLSILLEEIGALKQDIKPLKNSRKEGIDKLEDHINIKVDLTNMMRLSRRRECGVTLASTSPENVGVPAENKTSAGESADDDKK